MTENLKINKTKLKNWSYDKKKKGVFVKIVFCFCLNDTKKSIEKKVKA